MLHYCTVIVLFAVTTIAAALGVARRLPGLVHVVIDGKHGRQGMAKFGLSWQNHWLVGKD